MPGRNLNLLSLDGGGIRGLSSLYILQRIMVSINPDNPPKPCDYFDLIGGTSTGGLIAIMLGRLEMSVDECIKAYLELSDNVFHKKHRVPADVKGNLRERYDSKNLELAVKRIIQERGLDEDALLKDPQGTKVFVCCTSGETSQTSLLRSWHTPRGDPDLYRTVRIWEAARATSAASSFFDPIDIGEPRQRFLDGGTGANNPVNHVWGEATDLLGFDESLPNNLNCLLTIGTGQPGYKPFENSVLGIGKTLIGIVTETEDTANEFHRGQSKLFQRDICFRFNVPRGLGDIGLAETEERAVIKAMTTDYLQSEIAQNTLRRCVQRLQERQLCASGKEPALILQSLNRIAQDEGDGFISMSQDTRWQLGGSKDKSHDLLERISSYQPQRVHTKIKLMKVHGTTDWITEEPEGFLSWLDGVRQRRSANENCFWISGIIGCGKTFLANTAVQFLLDRQEGMHVPEPVVFFYFDPNKREMLKAEALLRSYVKQLLRYMHIARRELPSHFTTALRRIFRSHASEISCSEVMEDLLIPLTLEFEEPYFIVDGLDLCSRDEYKQALKYLSSILKRTPARIIICGRDELNIKNRLPGSKHFQVTPTKTKDDIARFVKHHMNERTTLDGPISDKENTLTRIVETLIGKANGMFLWARLQIDVLWDTCTTDDEIDVALSNLPPDLDTTYERCLERLQEKQAPYALRVLHYVYGAKNPLTIDALGEALAIDPTSGELSSQKIPPHRFIIDSGANLIVFDEIENMVVPAHHSVKQFLNSGTERQKQLELHVWHDAELKLGEMCIVHLLCQMDTIKMSDENLHQLEVVDLRLPSIPQMSRWARPHEAMSHWTKIPWPWANKSRVPPKIGNSPVVIKRLVANSRGSTPTGAFEGYAKNNWLTLSHSITNDSMLWDQFSTLCFSRPNDPRICPWARPGQLAGIADIIWWAIDQSHAPLFHLAVDQPSFQSIDLGLGFSTLCDRNKLLPIHLASQRGSLEIFESLIKFCDIRSRCPTTAMTALHYAVAYDRCDLIRFLLEKAPDMFPETRDDHQTALDLAIAAGSLRVLQIMESFWTLLDFDQLLDKITSKTIDRTVVEYVLQKSVPRNPHNPNKLLARIVWQNLSHLVPIVSSIGVSLETKIWFASKSSTNSPESNGAACEPIFLALQAQTSELAKALVENGANCDVCWRVPSPDWGIRVRPVDLALSRGWTDVASLIIDETSNNTAYNMFDIDIFIPDKRVTWFTVLVANCSIADIHCLTHHSCQLAAKLGGFKQKRFLFVDFEESELEECGSFRIKVTSLVHQLELRKQHGLQVRLQLGGQQYRANPALWRGPLRTESPLAITIKSRGGERVLRSNAAFHGLHDLCILDRAIVPRNMFLDVIARESE